MLQVRLDESEANAMKGGKRMLQKMEQRVRELEVELDNEQRRHTETSKGLKRQDRRLKVISFDLINWSKHSLCFRYNRDVTTCRFRS